MKRIMVVAVLCCTAFTLQTSGQSSGQTTTTYTFACPTVLLIPTVQSQLPDTLTPPVSAQVVFIGKQPDKNYCYKIETIRPNLVLSQSVHILGHIFVAAAGLTPDTAPLKNSRVELRKYISQRNQTTVKVTTTDEKGYFDMGTVEAGKYRFLASPDRSCQQPPYLQCPDGEKCELNIGLKLNPTDMPISFCPVR
jgi:hypothetical protein